MKKLVLSVAFAAIAGLASAAVVSPLVPRTLSLAKGWNAVFLDVTPEASDPAAFFAFADVTRVGSYRTGAYDSTAQYDSEGEPLNQKPISYLVWEKGSVASTLKTLTGGHVYLVYANAAASADYLGVPTLPKMSWLTGESSEGVISMVAPSLAAGVTVPAATYFAEGPWDRKTVYRVLGQNETAPTFLSDIGAKPKVTAGLGYAMCGAENRHWAGVIDVMSRLPGVEGLFFAKGETKSSLTIRNAGTEPHTFRVSLCLGEGPEGVVLPPLSLEGPVTNLLVAADWMPFTPEKPHELTLAPGASETLVFALDRTAIDGVTACGGILAVEDLSGTGMRVETTVLVDTEAVPEDHRFPAGVWVGQLALSHVTRDEDPTELYAVACGKMRLNFLIRVDKEGKATLLQHLAAAAGGQATTTFLSVETPEVADEGKFGDTSVFRWSVPASARDNPFRHAHHPDHAEGFAVANELTLSWHENNDPGKPSMFAYNADGTSWGFAHWVVSGLTASRPVKTLGVFTLKRLDPKLK